MQQGWCIKKVGFLSKAIFIQQGYANEELILLMWSHSWLEDYVIRKKKKEESIKVSAI